MKVSFRIRRIYFDQIVRGEKTIEFRRWCPYWFRVAFRVGVCFNSEPPVPVVAVFVCGKNVHRRRLVRKPTYYADAQAALGRAPSVQGAKDLGTGQVIGFHLGAVWTPADEAAIRPGDVVAVRFKDGTVIGRVRT